ncbi:hypothetical protein IMZ48_12110 [Candidatus Bathyarchaeota archaeon]|nr:hypothetical protein [Candidatus Bathyarchaeota archaeon]
MTYFPNNFKGISALANYSEPFYCECRAFARLQEAGREELATRCFGYILLDEAHEAAARSIVKPTNLNFGSEDGDEDYNRLRFPAEAGRPSPIRGIIKEFGEVYQNPQAKDFRGMLRNAVALQQHGIINLELTQ